MKHLPRFNALGKLKALTHATARVRAELAGQAPSHAPSRSSARHSVEQSSDGTLAKCSVFGGDRHAVTERH